MLFQYYTPDFFNEIPIPRFISWRLMKPKIYWVFAVQWCSKRSEVPERALCLFLKNPKFRSHFFSPTLVLFSFKNSPSNKFDEDFLVSKLGIMCLV